MGSPLRKTVRNRDLTWSRRQNPPQPLICTPKKVSVGPVGIINAVVAIEAASSYLEYAKKGPRAGLGEDLKMQMPSCAPLANGQEGLDRK